MPYTEFDPIPLPEGVFVKKPVICVSDVHGSVNLFAEAMDEAVADPSSPLIANLGDLTNRGFDSMICVMVVLEMAKTRDGLINIRGNHCSVIWKLLTRWNRESSLFLEKHGGAWLLDIVEAARKKDPQAMKDLDAVKRWLRLQKDYHVHQGGGSGAVLLTHATPEPIRHVRRCDPEQLRWSYPKKMYQSRSPLVGGVPCINVHGHVSSEYKGMRLKRIEEVARKMVAEEGRLNIDGGMPYSSRLLTARLEGGSVVIRAYEKKTKKYMLF